MISNRLILWVLSRMMIRAAATTMMIRVRWSGWNRRRDRPLPHDPPLEPPKAISGPARSGPVGVVDAVPGGRHDLQPGRPDGHAALLASSVGAVLQPFEGPGH